MIKIAESFLHIHVLALIFICVIVVWKLSVFCRFMKEVLSEQLPSGAVGKGSSKRFILMLIGGGVVYGWIYSLHTGKDLDHYALTVLVIFLMLGLAIIKPDQANSLLDKLKSLTTFTTSKEALPEGGSKETATGVKIENQKT